MRKATPEQIETWVGALVCEKRLSLPLDHPRKIRNGGYAAAEIRKRARNARTHLAKRGLLPTDEQLTEKANGGVNLEAVRAERAAKEERDTLMSSVVSLAGVATTEKLRAALAALET